MKEFNLAEKVRLKGDNNPYYFREPTLYRVKNKKITNQISTSMLWFVRQAYLAGYKKEEIASFIDCEFFAMVDTHNDGRFYAENNKGEVIERVF